MLYKMESNADHTAGNVNHMCRFIWLPVNHETKCKHCHLLFTTNHLIIKIEKDGIKLFMHNLINIHKASFCHSVHSFKTKWSPWCP